jgi:ABC-type phosphonate transport system ATPase subunit
VIAVDGLTEHHRTRVAVDDVSFTVHPGRVTGFLAVPTSWPVGLAVTLAWAAAAWVLGAGLLERRDV